MSQTGSHNSQLDDTLINDLATRNILYKMITTGLQHTYRCLEVTDIKPDSCYAVLDLGFFNTSLKQIKLLGIEEIIDYHGAFLYAKTWFFNRGNNVFVTVFSKEKDTYGIGCHFGLFHAIDPTKNGISCLNDELVSLNLATHTKKEST